MWRVIRRLEIAFAIGLSVSRKSISQIEAGFGA
jgi:DNA-binding XRE family transcriptional regulator